MDELLGWSDGNVADKSSMDIFLFFLCSDEHNCWSSAFSKQNSIFDRKGFDERKNAGNFVTYI